MDKHLQIVAVLHIALGILGLCFAAGVFFIFIGAGMLADDHEAMTVLSIVGTVIAGLTGITSVPSIIGGMGLWRRRAWGRLLLIVVSVFDLLNIPVGTALGAYSLWVLFQDESAKLVT